MGKYGVYNECSSSRSDFKRSFRIKIHFVFLFIATTLLFTSPFVINDAFAIKTTIVSSVFYNNSPSELKWQMVFISSSPACSNYHYQMLYTYFDFAIEYLKLYAVENIPYDSLCFTEKKYLSNYENPPDLDLLILVYDNDLGEKELHANQMGGIYTHSGSDRTQNHVIIICDCSNFDYSSPFWILSHEMSHFILYYKDFEMSVIESLIHVNDVKHDQCLDQSTTCKSSSIKMVAGPGGYAYSVMPIYQPAVGLQTGNEVINDDAKSPNSLEISKIITQWWATGIISDAQYSNAIGYLVDSTYITSPVDVDLILADGPLRDEITWEQRMEETIPTYWAHAPKSEDDSMGYLSKIPSNMISNDNNQIMEKKIFGVPDWFKETALLWGEEMITDAEFKNNIEYLVKQSIIASRSSNVFQNLLVESESRSASPSIHVPINEQNSDESLSQDSISEEPSKILIESVPEKAKPIPINVDGIRQLFEYANSIPDIHDGVALLLQAVLTSFEDGNINLACTNLEYYFDFLENQINSDKIDQSLGQSLIAEGEIIKIDLCI